ncbi:VanZ family protein [Thermophilibacter mediterraneus]|uniref:VanZ family protein n=1 Tax=Thermophilibacter mediterraneus TaxID=1871031 RepID=UPI0023528BA6|nr:VanZ family protein [Thermophilibacter mediterraneus]
MAPVRAAGNNGHGDRNGRQKARRTVDMNLIRRFLSGYTDNFLMAVALWPLASVVLTLPILAWLYHRDGRLRFASAVSTYLAVLYVLGLGCFTLWPLPSGDSGLGITYGVPWQLDPLAFVGDFAREGVSTLPQIAFNVVLFMPLGFIAGRLLRWGPWRSVAAGLAASLVIEVAQGTGLFGVYPYAYRTADVDDLIYNTLGAALGWACAAALARVLPPGALAEEGEVTHDPGFVRRCVALWLDTLVVGLASLAAGGVAGILLGAAGAPGGMRQQVMELALYVAFAWVEVVVPWRRGGSTPGGAFVRMSCETRERTGARRLAFYAARTVVLGGAYLFFPLAWPLLALFYLVARKMPYDLV